MFVGTAECSKRSPRVWARKSPVLLCRSSSVRGVASSTCPRATLRVIPQAGPTSWGHRAVGNGLFCFVLFFVLSASTSSPAPAESGEMRSFFFSFAASDSVCQLRCDDAFPAAKSHDKSCTSSLCVSLKTAAACAVCVCACFFFFFFVVCRVLSRACCFPVVFGQPCCVL